MGESRNLLEVKLGKFDPEVDALIRGEMQRNEETINLIASECSSSPSPVQRHTDRTARLGEPIPAATMTPPQVSTRP